MALIPGLLPSLALRMPYHPIFHPLFPGLIHPIYQPLSVAVGQPGQPIPPGRPAPGGLWGIGNGRPPKPYRFTRISA